jgi:hypothetical protein
MVLVLESMMKVYIVVYIHKPRDYLQGYDPT